MAVSFSGSPDLIDMGLGSALNITTNNPMALVCWANFTTFAGTQNVVSKGFDGGNTGYFINNIAGVITMGSFNGTTNGASSTPGWSVNTWHHIYGDYTGSIWHLYLDGVLANTSGAVSGPVGVALQKFYVGAVDNNGAPSQFFSGCAADVALFNNPLTGTEITNLANGSLRPNTSMSQTLLGYWKLDTAASTQTDFSVNGNTGTAVGGAITNTCASGPTFVGAFLPPTFTQSPILQVRNRVLAY